MKGQCIGKKLPCGELSDGLIICLGLGPRWGKQGLLDDGMDDNDEFTRRRDFSRRR